MLVGDGMTFPVVDHALRSLGTLGEADIVARLAAGPDAPGQTPYVSALMTRRVLSVTKVPRSGYPRGSPAPPVTTII
jgi:hypothetical protein